VPIIIFRFRRAGDLLSEGQPTHDEMKTVVGLPRLNPKKLSEACRWIAVTFDFCARASRYGKRRFAGPPVSAARAAPGLSERGAIAIGFFLERVSRSVGR
jgi:hypothetical protein